MSNPIITSAILPPQASTLAGGSALIYGSDFQDGCIVLFGKKQSLNVDFINSGFIAADIPSVKIAGTYNITVTNPDGGTVTQLNAFTAIAPVILESKFPYVLLVNGTDITKYQRNRFSLTQATNMISSYSVAFNKLSVEIPLEKQDLLFEAPSQNNFTIKDLNGVIKYQGYVDQKEIDECLKIIKIDSMPFLNLLSKNPQTITQTGTQNAASLLVSLLRSFVALLPVQYNVSPFVINGTLLDNVNIGVYMASELNAIDILQNLLDLLEVGLLLYNNTIFLFAIPEDLSTQKTTDISGIIAQPLNNIKDLSGLFYEQYSLKYKLTGTGADQTPVTAGSGNVIKSLTADNVFFDTAQSAQNLVNRKQRLYVNTWKTAECSLNRQFDVRLGMYLIFHGLFDDYVFLVTSIEDMYVNWKVKLYGQKVPRKVV